MKRRLVISVFMTLAAFVVNASTIDWNATVIEGWGGDDYNFRYPYLRLTVQDRGDSLEFMAFAESNLAGANTFALAAYGDFIDSVWMESQSKFFAYARHDDPYNIDTRTDYSIVINYGENVYLAYRGETGLGTRYGWVQLGVDEIGNPVILSSARDLDGDGIIVGPTPEPSSLHLLLVGLALFSLRRRRR